MSKRIPIKLTYPKQEWKILEELAVSKGANNFQDYLKDQLNQLAKKCPAELLANNSEKLSRNYIIPPNICNKLITLSYHRNIPLGALIRWYISDPILLAHYEGTFKLLALP